MSGKGVNGPPDTQDRCRSASAEDVVARHADLCLSFRFLKATSPRQPRASGDTLTHSQRCAVPSGLLCRLLKRVRRVRALTQTDCAPRLCGRVGSSLGPAARSSRIVDPAVSSGAPAKCIDRTRAFTSSGQMEPATPQYASTEFCLAAVFERRERYDSNGCDVSVPWRHGRAG